MFDLKKYLAERRDLVEEELVRILPLETARPAVLHEAMRYSVLSGGKRVRPILCIACAECTVPDGEGADERRAELRQAALGSAIGLELFHTYTLIHDDLPCMDDDDERRGRPTSHIVFGEANAVLAGDALHALAFEVTARSVAPPPYPPNQLVVELAVASGSEGVVGGQIEDVAAVGTTPPRDVIEYIHRCKTAALFRAACRIGAIIGAASEEHLTAITAYSEALGVAFQITDDLLDIDALEERGEASCLSVYSEEEARARSAELIQTAIDAAAILPAESTRQPLIALAEYVRDRTY